MGTRRLSAAAGIGFVVLTLVSELLKGNSPSPTGSAGTIVSYFDEHRTGILTGAYVQMLGLFLLAVVALGAAGLLWSAGRRTEAALAALATALLIAAYTTYVFLTAALGFGAGTDAAPATAKSLWQIRFVAETFIAFPAALLAGAIAAGAFHSRVFPRWYAWASALVAAAFLVGGATLARHGFFAPDGGYGFIVFWLLPLWIAATGIAPRRTVVEP